MRIIGVASDERTTAGLRGRPSEIKFKSELSTVGRGDHMAWQGEFTLSP